MKNKKIVVLNVFGSLFILMLLGMMIMPVAAIFAEDECPVPEEFQYRVTLRVHLERSSSTETVTVWATRPSEAEERAKQQYRDNNPRILSQILSIAAINVVKL